MGGLVEAIDASHARQKPRTSDRRGGARIKLTSPLVRIERLA
jgi:hypothetical protein